MGVLLESAPIILSAHDIVKLNPKLNPKLRLTCLRREMRAAWEIIFLPGLGFRV